MSNEGTSEGVVRMFNTVRGFGFITRQGAPDLFVHITDVVGGGPDGLRVGDRVRFVVAVGPKGPRAFNVRKVDGEGFADAWKDPGEVTDVG